MHRKQIEKKKKINKETIGGTNYSFFFLSISRSLAKPSHCSVYVLLLIFSLIPLYLVSSFEGAFFLCFVCALIKLKRPNQKKKKWAEGDWINMNMLRVCICVWVWHASQMLAYQNQLGIKQKSKSNLLSKCFVFAVVCDRKISTTSYSLILFFFSILLWCSEWLGPIINGV